MIEEVECFSPKNDGLSRLQQRIGYEEACSVDSSLQVSSDKRLFTPPRRYRGLIARQMMMLMMSYPYLEQVIPVVVLREEWMKRWLEEYEMTDFEREWRKCWRE